MPDLKRFTDEHLARLAAGADDDRLMNLAAEVLELRARVTDGEERSEKRRIRLAAAEEDLLEVRGALSPNGRPRRIPAEVDIRGSVVPAVEWLLARVAELETTAIELLAAHRRVAELEAAHAAAVGIARDNSHALTEAKDQLSQLRRRPGCPDCGAPGGLHPGRCAHAVPATPHQELARIARNLMEKSEFHSPATFALACIDAILAEGWRPAARVIESVEQLDQAAQGTIIRQADGSAAVAQYRVYGKACWFEDGCETQFSSDDLALPAVVVWEPERPTAPRPWTEPRRNPDGSQTMTVKIACRSCSRLLGDATAEEIDQAAAGLPPDVSAECGCAAGAEVHRG